jgi:hypothetical protein
VRRPHPSRGAALPLALILLAVLTAIAVAAVSLSGQERANAASYGRIDFVNACAHAAQAKVWSEIAYQGTSYLNSSNPVTYIKLPDGTVLASPSHYDQAATALVKNVAIQVQASEGASSGQLGDCTNRACMGAELRPTYGVIAHCTDVRGRSLEIELGVRFAL